MSYDDGPFLNALCRQLELASSPKLIRSNTNLIYDCGDSILRLTPNAFRSEDEVRRELHWMAFVGNRTPDVVHQIGEGTRQFVQGDESFTVAVMEKIEGTPVDKEKWDSNHFEQLGKFAGKLHRIGQEYSPPSEVALKEWDDQPEADLVQNLPDDDRELPKMNRLASEYMAAMPRVPKHYGPIHYDIHAGNYLLTADGRMVLFDFENSCLGHFINDIAVVLYYARLSKMSGDDEGFAASFMDSFWKGYEKEYPIQTDDLPAIPWLLLNRGLIVYAYILKIWPGERDEEQVAVVNRVEQMIARDRVELGI